MAQKGSALKGALARTPSQGLQRLSPGVYRNQQGQLVGSTGKTLPGQRPQQPQPHTMPGVAKTPQLPQQPQMQQPQYGQGMYYAGGSPNFNELTGQYNFPQQPFSNQFQSGLGFGVGAAFGGQPSSMPQQQAIGGFSDFMRGQATGVQPMYKGNVY